MGGAFEFLDELKDGVFKYLAGREGRGFTRIWVRPTLTPGEAVEAFTYRYDGRSVITTSDVTALAEMATASQGHERHGRRVHSADPRGSSHGRAVRFDDRRDCRSHD